jgi:hypothetical protein
VLSRDYTAPWLYSNYVQLKLDKRSGQVYFYDGFINRDSPFVRFQRLSKELVNKKWKVSIIDFIKDCIQSGFYLFFYGQKKMSASSMYQISDFDHDVFVYGFDDDKQQLHLAGNFKNGKYSCETCTYQESRVGRN